MRYYLHVMQTKNGQTRFVPRKTVSEGALAVMPEGYDFDESLGGVVSVRRVTERSRVPMGDFKRVTAAVDRHRHLREHVVERCSDRITIHEPDPDPPLFSSWDDPEVRVYSRANKPHVRATLSFVIAGDWGPMGQSSTRLAGRATPTICGGDGWARGGSTISSLASWTIPRRRLWATRETGPTHDDAPPPGPGRCGAGARVGFERRPTVYTPGVKAITYRRYGPPEVLRVEEVRAPKPKDDQILIRVRAAEATKSDCELRSFKFAIKWFVLPLRLAVGVFRPRRRILGAYLAGEVVEVGKSVTDFAVGDEVFGSTGLGMGAYGELVAVPGSSTLVRKPANMSFAEAAAVPLGGLNALHFLRRAEIEPGEKVLVIGAGGSIGLHGVQIAKTMGAEVTAVDKALKEDLVRGMGADHFIDYTRESFADRGEKYDVVFDMVPTSSFRPACACSPARGATSRATRACPSCCGACGSRASPTARPASRSPARSARSSRPCATGSRRASSGPSSTRCSRWNAPPRPTAGSRTRPDSAALVLAIG